MQRRAFGNRDLVGLILSHLFGLVADKAAFIGMLVYVFDEGDQAPHVQNEVLMDPAVRFFGNQNPAVKLARDDANYELNSTPALLVIGKDGKIKKQLEGKAIKAKSLASALKKIAPNRKMPKG